jgi:hypothetical protein
VDLRCGGRGRRQAQRRRRPVVLSLLPKGYERESFAGLEAQELNAARIAELTGFIERSLQVSGVPSTSLGMIQDGEVVFLGGFGVRELGRPWQVVDDFLSTSRTPRA